MADLTQLQADLGHVFRDEALLRLALTHPSVAQEKAGPRQHNQRLEFLGDAVLQVVLSRELYERLPAASEGDLTKTRARLVNRRTLAEQGRRLGLGGCLELSRGEEVSGGRQRSSALADAYEAVLGAVFVDGGFEAAREVILGQLSRSLDEALVRPDSDNPKGDLQEALQARGEGTPFYRLEGISGPDHARQFECSVHCQGVELGRGLGASKQEAESRAALAALGNLGSVASSQTARSPEGEGAARKAQK